MKTQLATLSSATSRSCQAGKLDARLGAWLAFGAAVCVSIIAAVAVTSNELPLSLGGF